MPDVQLLRLENACYVLVLFNRALGKASYITITTMYRLDSKQFFILLQTADIFVTQCC
jgi:hypothetical protein